MKKARTTAPQAPTTPPEPKDPRARLHAWLVATLVALALGLRLWGIGWGLTAGNMMGSFHPDEGVNIINAVLERGEPRPHLDLRFYNYGSLYFYLHQAGTAVNFAYGLVKVGDAAHNVPATSEDLAAVVLVGRLLTALMGALTVWAVFALGSRLFGARTGFAAAALYAVMPAAVVHGHYATPDVPATFLVTVALALGARLLTRTDARACVAAGVLCGLAAATKYNMALVTLAPLAALFARRKLAGGVPRVAPLIVVGAAIVGFVVACPGVLINWPKFSQDFLFELRKSGEGMGLLFVNTGSGFVYHIARSLRYGMGEPLLVVGLVAVGFACFRRSRQDGYLAAFALPYYLVIGCAQVRFLRYTIPLLPVLSVLIARMAFEGAAGTEPGHPSARGKVVAALVAVAACFSLFVSVAHDTMMVGVDARDRAAEYLERSRAEDDAIAFGTTPWFYSPPLEPEFTAPIPGVARNRMIAGSGLYWLRQPAQGREWDLSVLDPPAPRFVVLSAAETYNPERLRQPEALAFLERVRSGYSPRVFENRCLGLPRPDSAPEDWLYAWPRVTVYERRGR